VHTHTHIYTYIYTYTYLVSVMWNEESTSVINRSLMCIHRSNNRRCNTLRHTATHKHDLPQHKQTCWSIKRRSTTGMSRRKRLLVCTHSTFSETSAFFSVYHEKMTEANKPFLVCRYQQMRRGAGLGSRPKKMYGERLGDGVEYHSMKPTPRR